MGAATDYIIKILGGLITMKKVIALVMTALFSTTMVACGTAKSGSTAPSSKAASADEIVIGSLQDTSGPTSVNGKAIDEGVDYAANAINAKGGFNGKKIRVVHYDTKGNVQEAINAYNRLSTQDKVSAIVGPPVANIGIAIAPVSEQGKTPIIGGYLDLRCTTKADGSPYKYMFRVQPSAPQQAEIMASYAMEEMGIKKFAIFYNQANAYSVSLEQPFKQYVTSHGGQVVAEEVYGNNDKDYKTQLSKIKKAEPEAIYAPNYTQELVLFAQQARSLGITTPFISGLDAATPFSELAGASANNTVFPNNISNDEPQLQDVLKAYKTKTGKEPMNKFYVGYDSVSVILEAIKIAGSTDAVKVAAAMEQVKDVQGMTGNITINPKTHQPDALSMVMFEIKDGKYIPKKRYAAKN
jgi:branched-chain amino acid transport system substrate-binding protein